MTQISSHSSATTPRSCVTNSIDKPNSRDQIAQQIEDLLLRRDVERGRRLVGDDQRRRAGERRGDQQPLPLPARELVRIAFERRLRVGQLHAAQQRRSDAGAVLAAAACRPWRMPAHDLEKLRADLEDRVQRQIRVLRDEADAAAADAPVQLALAERQQVFAGKADLAGFDPRALRQDAEDGADHGRLAAAGLADDAEDAAGLEREIDMVEDARDALVGADRQPAGRARRGSGGAGLDVIASA